ncbi:MAG: hypothetical protein IJ131_04310 [Eggerthellaceae bacterium]|nr:hypothetical protein [Eggerthellaceae bacterium]
MAKHLHYGCAFKDLPDRSTFDCNYIVRTDHYQDANDWSGTVVKVGRNGNSSEKSFDSLTSLAQALA